MCTKVSEENYLQLSGIQHYKFCRRQWALIHIEQQWQENVLTVQGQHLHQKADEPFIREKRGNKLVVRALPVHSRELGISGICDVVEFVLDDKEGVPLKEEEGSYRPIPVEYKRGKPKKDKSDILQLVAQAICLEEMLVCHVPMGCVFYNETKRRLEVPITAELRDQVKEVCFEMHRLYAKSYTPKAKEGPHCMKCSLYSVCMPSALQSASVASYLDRRLKE